MLWKQKDYFTDTRNKGHATEDDWMDTPEPSEEFVHSGKMNGF